MDVCTRMDPGQRDNLRGHEVPMSRTSVAKVVAYSCLHTEADVSWVVAPGLGPLTTNGS